MPLLRKKKEDEITEDELALINEMSVQNNRNPLSFAILLAKANEKINNPIFGVVLDNFKPDANEVLKELENKIINEAIKLMVLNLLDDIDNDYYIEQMENLKDKLKALRKIEKKLVGNDSVLKK